MGADQDEAGAEPVKYRIEFTPGAERHFSKLSRDVQFRIGAKIDALASDPRPDGCRKLADTEDGYRIRIGDYRVLYQVKDDLLRVLVVKVAKREEAYRR